MASYTSWYNTLKQLWMKCRKHEGTADILQITNKWTCHIF